VPQQLYDAPDLAEWAVGQKAGTVSPVVASRDAFFIAQVADQRAAGPAPKEDVIEQLRSVAETEARVRAARPRAEQLMKLMGSGMSLENAASAVGVQALKLTAVSRESTDPRIAGFPDVLGAAFVTPVGKVAGPVETPGGWMFLRVDGRLTADSTSYDQVKGQITSDILQRRQGDFLQAWTASQRLAAKVQDLRTP
jgi:parvulin-like peptidyl-prolyl isomerase